MERSRKILSKIASASQQVITTANEYANRKDLPNVERVHFRLEEEMRKVSIACDSLAGIILMSHGPAIDERPKDWLTSDEPRMCCETLDQMIKLLHEDAPSRTSTSLTVTGITAPEDKINEAVNLFDSREQSFHFLFATDFEDECGVRQHKDAPHSREDDIDGECNVLEQGLRPPVQTGLNTNILPEMAVRYGGQADVQRRQVTKVEELTKIENAKNLDVILNWLDGLNCAEKQDVTLSLRQPDTCKWFFDTSQYKTWRDGDSLVLWLRGKPGAGKSVLVSSVINSLEDSPRDGEFLIFFYCDFRNERSTRAAEAMRSILSQLLRQLRGRGVDLGSCINDLMKAKERGGATLKNAKQLAGFASDVARLVVQKPVVIVDALDECQDIQEFLQALMVLKDSVRLFVTSRPLHVIMDDFSGFPLVSLDEMADGLAADIELHVTQELDTRQRLKDLDTEFKTEVHSVVCKKADGMFRWVQCSLDTLNRCVTREQVRDALNSLPKGLDETYERILRAINANAWEGQLAQRALVWLVVALRPLHLDELMEGLSINLHTRTLDSNFGPMHKGALLDACGSLVTIERTGLIILSHFSVKEYLTGKFTRSKLPRYHVDRGLAHLHLARFCMCYISIYINHPQRFSRSSDTALHVSRVCPDRGDYLHIMSQRLRDYVLDHAPDHFSHIGSHIGSILHDIKVLEQDAHSHSRIWDNMCLSANRVTRCTTPVWPTSRHDFTLYILVAFGPVSVLRKFLRRTGFRPTEGTNPLVYAAYFNKREHACTLLSRGARLNRTGWDIDGFCPVFPIEAAFRNHHYDIVTLFLAEGSPIPPCIFTMVYDRDHKQIPSRVIKKLLQTDDFAEDAESSRTELVSRTLALLHRFLSDDDITEKDFIAIIRRAIQVGCDPCEVIHRQDTLIRIAIQRGYVTVACYLLSLGLSFPSDLLVTSTLLALRNSARIFHFLVESGVVDLAHLSKEKNVLHMSLENFEEPEVLDAARLLVAHDCDPLEANSRGETPLHIAVQQGHVSVVHYLRSLGAPLPSNLPLAIFNLSRSRNCTRMIRCLIEYGADTLALTSHGDSVLHIVLAAFSEYDALETAELLVAQGCNPFQTNSYGKTPLRIAVERRHVSVARYLHSIGAPLSPDQLFSSISRGMRNDARMIRFLVENGFDILARAENGDSLLHITMYTLHEDRALETAKLLVLHGCNPLEANSDEDTPLHIALTRGYVSVVHYLLSLDIPLPSNLPDTMSFWCKETCARMIRCLVENGADALALTSDGDTLLNIVLANFDERDALETAKLLVAHRCDPLQANSRGEIPLSIAVKRRQVSVARYLLSLGASPTSDHPIPPILRGTQDDARMIFFLVENGFDVFSRTGPSGDPLLHVVMNTFREDEVLAVTKLLLAHGCDALQLNSRGETPIRIAIERGHDSLVRYLLSLGVPLPCDALFIALYSGRLEGDSLGRSEMVHFLVDQGANIFTRQSDGGSVLHAAIIAFPRDTDDPKPDVLDVITFLVVRGCDPAIPNTRGDTPLHVAVKQGDVMIVEHLLSLKAPLPSDILLTAIRSDLISSSHWHWVMHVIEVLVTSGCHPLARNGAGYTPLRAAVIMGYVPVVDYFLTVMDSPPSDDLFSAVALAPLTVRNEMMSMLNDRLARSESPDVTDLQPPAKRTRYS